MSQFFVLLSKAASQLLFHVPVKLSAQVKVYEFNQSWKIVRKNDTKPFEPAGTKLRIESAKCKWTKVPMILILVWGVRDIMLGVG